MLDIFSRYVVGWTVAAAESAELATEFIDDVTATHGTPQAIHADRGTSMTSKPVAQLLVDLGVARSHSRPQVSNDNPYSEAAVQDPEVLPRLPRPVRLDSTTPARSARQFFDYYNHDHRHSGLGLHTPASVHYGTATAIRAAPRRRPARRLRPQPRTVQPTANTTETAHRRVDQPTHTGPPTYRPHNQPVSLSRPEAHCQDYSRPVSSGPSPNPPCASQRNGLSTVSAVKLVRCLDREWGSLLLGSDTG